MNSSCGNERSKAAVGNETQRNNKNNVPKTSGNMLAINTLGLDTGEDGSGAIKQVFKQVTGTMLASSQLIRSNRCFHSRNSGVVEAFVKVGKAQLYLAVMTNVFHLD